MVDLVDIGLMNVNDAAGRRRLNETIDQLTGVIQQGLAGTVGNFRFGVTSLRQCTSGNQIETGCSNGRVLAEGSPSPPPIFSGGIKAHRSICYWLFATMAFLLYHA